MKPPAEWSEQDLLELINQKYEESLQLDFKRAESLDSSDKKKIEISKDVSAFANSAGGTVVYGIAESQQEPRCAESLSPIDPSKYSKEWIEQIINSRIQPRIQGVLINPVSLANGKAAYVVCIPQSTTAHQASDHRYYKRYNFESVPMEDYEVRQTLNRVSRAEYQIKLNTIRKGLIGQLPSFELQCFIENISELMARDVSAILLVPKHLIQGAHYGETVIAGGVYSRIPGAWAAMPLGSNSAINIAPSSPRLLFFDRTLCLPFLQSAEPLRVFVKLFDQLGLALISEVLLSVPDLNVISTHEVPKGL